jgi:PAS domain S-box-containing protein
MAVFGAIPGIDLRLLPGGRADQSPLAEGNPATVILPADRTGVPAALGIINELADISPVLTFLFLLGVLRWSFSLRKRLEDQTQSAKQAQDRAADWERRYTSEIKAAETAMRQSADQFTSLFSLSPMAMAVCSSAEWRFLEVNDSFVRLVGFERYEVLNHTMAELALWADPANQAEVERVLWNEELVRGAECRWRAKSGDPRTTILFAKRISLGNLPCALIILQDITEHLNLAAQLGEALQSRATGNVPPGAAEEVDRRLKAVEEMTDLALRRTSGPPEVVEHFSRIHDAIQGLASTIRQWLVFSGEHELNCQPLDLNETIQKSIHAQQHRLRDDIVVKYRFYPNLPAIRADAVLVETMMTTLVDHACLAMPNGGDLTITTAPVEISRSYAENHPEAIAGQFICLSVADTGSGTGPGAHAPTLERLPTGTVAGNGADHGLAVVAGIVKQHGGWIKTVSQVGQGSTLRIFLPSTPACG